MANMSYVLSLDQGTSSTRAIIFDKDSKQIKSHQLEHNQYYPQEGWVEVRICSYNTM